MNLISTLISWGKSALGAITGGAADVAGTLLKLWRYVTQVHNVLSWLTGGPELRAVLAVLYNLSTLHLAQVAILGALRRLAGWIWLTIVQPQVRRLDMLIARLRSLLLWWVAALKREMIALYFAGLAYTRQQVGAERAARIQADRAEHAAMLARVAWALATVQHQAASGYNAGTRERLGVIATLLNDIADRQPEVRALVTLLVRHVVDLESVDNPVLRFTIGRIVSELVARLGVDKVTGDLVSRLLGTWTAEARPSDLTGVERDVAARLTALEQQWADFMTAGGPEVEQAGREWRAVTSPLADVAILGVFALAVTDPRAFATGVADTAGAAVNDTAATIARLIRVR